MFKPLKRLKSPSSFRPILSNVCRKAIVCSVVKSLVLVSGLISAISIIFFADVRPIP